MAGNTAEIKTKLTADGSELTRALNQGITKAADFRGQMSNLGKIIGTAFTGAAIARFAVNLGEVADSVQDAAGALSLSTDELQAFDAVARGTAGGVDGMRAAIKKLVEVQADAAAGSDTASKILDKLGLGSKAATASTAELVKALADYYKQTGDLATVHDLFGRQAVEVREALDGIANQSIPGLISSMKAAGLVIDSNGLQTMAKFNLMLEESKVKMASWAISAVESYRKAGEVTTDGAAKQNPFERYVTALGVQLSALLEGKGAEAAADAGNRYFLGLKQVEERAKLLNPQTPEQIRKNQDLVSAQKQAADDLAAYEEDHHNAAYEAELERINKLSAARMAAADEEARAPDNAQYDADLQMMQAKLYMEQEAADLRRDTDEKSKRAAEELADIAAKRQSEAFDWAMALAEADISASTPGKRQDAEWFGSALNRIGALGSVKGSDPSMQLSKDQLAALKKIAEYVAPIKNIVLGTFQQ